MFNIYAGEVLASSCNGRKYSFSLTWAMDTSLRGRKVPDQCLIFQIYGV